MKKLWLVILWFASLFLFWCSFFWWKLEKVDNTNDKWSIENNVQSDTNEPQEWSISLKWEVTVYFDSNCKEWACLESTLQEIMNNQIKVTWATIKYIDLQSNADKVTYLQWIWVTDTPVLEVNKEQFDAFNQAWSQIIPYFQQVWDNYYLSFYSWEYWKENNCTDWIDNDWDWLVDWDDVKDCSVSILLTDSRCTADDDMLCDTQWLKQQIQWSIFPVWYILKEIDVTTQEWKDLYAQYKQAWVTWLPLLSTSFLKPLMLTSMRDQWAIKDIQVWDQKYLITWITWKWNSELADKCFVDWNVDCKNDACKEYKQCLPEEKATLDLYIMWYCPFWELAAEALPDFMKQFKDDKVNLNIHYIAEHVWQWYTANDFNSLHWAPEAEENIRQLCINKEYWKEKLVEYFVVRYKNKTNTWEIKDDPKLAVDAIGWDYNKIKECVENWEWWKMLAEDVKIAQNLWVSGSPTWYANKKYKFWWYNPASIIAEFCKYNQELNWCKVPFEWWATQPSTGNDQPQCN